MPLCENFNGGITVGSDEFFTRLLKNDMSKLELFESRIDATENALISSSPEDCIQKIISYRKELLELKIYYQQLDMIFDNLLMNDNGLLSQDSLRYFSSLHNRTERFLANVLSLRDYVSQMREAYQSQIDIEQNKLMKVFTVVTTIFLPLTLLVGWYGMNFNMPEFGWRFGYPCVILASVLISVSLVVFFKIKKLF